MLTSAPTAPSCAATCASGGGSLSSVPNARIAGHLCTSMSWSTVGGWRRSPSSWTLSKRLGSEENGILDVEPELKISVKSTVRRCLFTVGLAESAYVTSVPCGVAPIQAMTSGHSTRFMVSMWPGLKRRSPCSEGDSWS